ncbi:hypothetical protein WJX81_006981 [Elliptochloris bilobata]|uniref:Uncharacterized protein n=1 Tax=Elliptochloris bilobata TaxID=381761 RepID=A0AAW1RWM7_9CHLO
MLQDAPFVPPGGAVQANASTEPAGAGGRGAGGRAKTFRQAVNAANAAVNKTGDIPEIPSEMPNLAAPPQTPPTQMGGGSASAIALLKPPDGAAAVGGGGDAGALPPAPAEGISIDTRAGAMAPSAAIWFDGAPALPPGAIIAVALPPGVIPAAVVSAQPQAPPVVYTPGNPGL